MKTHEEWLKQINLKEQENKLLKSESFKYSITRLCAIGMLLFGVALSGYYHNQKGNMMAAVGLAAFIIFVIQHNKIKKVIMENEQQIAVLNRYIARLSDEWQNFEEDGSAFIKQADPTLLDLDILGHASLYQLICVAKTAIGKKHLYEILANTQEIDLLKRQEAIEELYQNQDFSLNYQTSLEAKKSQSMSAYPHLIETIELFNDTKNIKGLNLLCMIPLITLILGATAYFKIIAPAYFVIALLAQFLFSSILSMKYNNQLAKYSNVKELVSDYLNEVKLIEQETFHSDHLLDLQKCLTHKGKASKALSILDMELSMITLRNNAILYLVFNSLFMYDLQCIRVLENWKSKYGSSIKGWIQTLGDMEAWISCSLIPLARKRTCTPEIIESQIPKIKSSECAHPLINEEKVVANSFEISSGNIITGSNMSGKSTFMRSIGVNMILALAGCRVTCEAFTCSKMKIYSSMRLHDELASGISTFYAEILRIKEIMEESKKKEGMLILIDEIFKGTNSADRIVGSIEAIKKLNQPWILCMITTHDFELCTALPTLTNYHFEEHYVDNKINFDYLLLNGKCQTTNAQHLMRMAGIID